MEIRVLLEYEVRARVVGEKGGELPGEGREPSSRRLWTDNC